MAGCGARSRGHARLPANINDGTRGQVIPETLELAVSSALTVRNLEGAVDVQFDNPVECFNRVKKEVVDQPGRLPWTKMERWKDGTNRPQSFSKNHFGLVDC